MIYDLNFIGSTIKIERSKLGVTQKKLAETSGVSRATINALENFKASDVSVNTLSKILSSLEAKSINVINNNLIPNSIIPTFEFPYIWSSKNYSEDLIIKKVLERVVFEDIVTLCIHFGILKVTSVMYTTEIKDESILINSLTRIIQNIQKGMLRA